MVDLVEPKPKISYHYHHKSVEIDLPVLYYQTEISMMRLKYKLEGDVQASVF